MVKLRSIMFLVLAVFFGLIASRQISKYIEYRVQREKETVKMRDVLLTQDVVVASTDIPWGTRLTDEQLKVTSWPMDGVPYGAFSKTKHLIGRAAKTELVKGEPILEPKLAPEGFKGGMTGIIPDGKRAITISVNEVAGVAGFVLPGSRVDVILTIDFKVEGEKNSRSVSKILLENMLVLAVDQKMKQDENNPVIVNAVTLLAGPEEAEKLALANNKGKLQLAMRNGMDNMPSAASGISCVLDMLDMGAQKVDGAPSHKLAVEIIKGTKRSKVTFDLSACLPIPTLQTGNAQADMSKQAVIDAKESFEM